MLGSYGGRPMNEDESNITFDSEAGINAARLYSRLGKEAGMKTYGGKAARQAFAAGTLGIYIDSSSYLTRVVAGAGDRFKVTLLPLVVAAKDKSTVYFPHRRLGHRHVDARMPRSRRRRGGTSSSPPVPEGAKIVVENTGYAPTNELVLKDKSYLGEFYARNENSRRAHAQVAAYSGPWYAYPGAEGVAVTDLIGAALVDVIEGADPEDRIKKLAAEVRAKLKMK